MRCDVVGTLRIPVDLHVDEVGLQVGHLETTANTAPQIGVARSSSESTDVLSTLIVSLAAAVLRRASATACCLDAEGSEERELGAVGPWLAQAASVRTSNALKINRMNVSASKKGLEICSR